MEDYTKYDPYGTYETKGEDPYSILMRMSSWNKAIRSTISDVQESLDGTIERQSQIIQEVDKIELNVFDITSNLDGTVTRVGKLEVRSDEINAYVGRVDSRLGKAEAEIIVHAGDISLKANSATVTALATRVSTAEVNIDGLQGQINLRATTATVNALGTRVSTAEISINSLNSTITSKVSTTDYNGRTIASLINQSPYDVTIAASKINLYGAVTVLSDITGSLGTITSGTINSVTVNSAYINIYENVSIGNTLYLRGSGQRSVQFGSAHVMETSGGELDLYSLRGVTIGYYTTFSGTVDFSRANVTGLGGGGSTTVRYSASSRRLYVDLNGVQQGWINLDG